MVDLRGSRKDESELVTKLGMQYVSIPWHCPFPKDDTFARFLTLLRQNPGKKVFVHCRLGDDRTGMNIAAYRMAEQGWTAMQAKQEMEAFGFTLPHHFICPSLSSYEETFPQRFSTSPAFHSLRAPAQPHINHSSIPVRRFLHSILHSVIPRQLVHRFFCRTAHYGNR